MADYDADRCFAGGAPRFGIADLADNKSALIGALQSAAAVSLILIRRHVGRYRRLGRVD